MQRKSRRCWVIAIAISLACTAVPVRADLVIDDFDEITTGDWPFVSYSWSPFWGVPRTTDFELDDVLGGRRESWVVLDSEPQNPGVTSVGANVNVDDGYFEFFGAEGVRSSVGIRYITPGHALGGFEGIRVDFASMSIPADGEWRAYMVVGVDRVFFHPLWYSNGEVDSLYMPFDAIPEFRLGVIGPEEIGWVTFKFHVPEGTRYELDRVVAVVPEPAPVLLLIFGALPFLVCVHWNGRV